MPDPAPPALADPVPIELPRRVPYRTWPATLLIALAVGLYVGGLLLWDAHVPAARPLPPGQPIAVGYGVRYVPAPKWQMDVALTRPQRRSALFDGANRFSVSVGDWFGGPDGPLERQRALIERARGLRIEGEPESFETARGLRGQTFAYYGAQRAGRFWQMVDARQGALVQVDVSGPPDDLQDAIRDARAMLESMTLVAESP